MNWRAEAAPIIRAVIQRVGTDDQKALRAALRDAYPFGVRQYHPYKIWCDEIRAQLGTKASKKHKAAVQAGQQNLFS